MISTTQRNETNRGAASGPPVAIAAEKPVSPNDELRIGPLPEPTLFERLRGSWSLDALIPSFEPDPSMPARKGFRIAGALALGLHVVVLVAIVLFGRYLVFEFVDTNPPPDITMVEPGDFRPTDAPGRESSSANSGGPEGGTSSDGGGSNTDPAPATAGVIPKTSPVPSPVPLNLPPPMTPVSLPMDPSILGPDLPVPPPTDEVGLPGAPVAPGVPSAGGDGGGGIGDGPGGDGVGRGGSPTGPGGRPDPGGTGGTRGGGPPGGADGTGPLGPGGRIQNRNIRLVSKAKPVIPRKMLETQTFGTVTLSVTIGADGSVLGVVPVNTLSGGGTQAAIDAVYRCRFSPAIRNGVAVTETTTVRFDIRQN